MAVDKERMKVFRRRLREVLYENSGLTNEEAKSIYDMKVIFGEIEDPNEYK